MTSAISFGDANAGFQAGIIHGSVHTSFHLPAERPETPPRPLAVVPFDRDADFVEREVFDQIQTRCAAPGSWTALIGLGGVGKSQLAIELAHRTRERSPETWVFWVHASNVGRFEQSYRKIANRIKVPRRQDPKADVYQLVHDWLHDEGKGRWVLILDNVDDAGFLREARSADRGGNREMGSVEGKSSQPLISYVPRCQHGSVLITTRSRDAARQLVEERDMVSIEPMERNDALTLLQRKLGRQDGGEEVAELAATLEYMPLAIVQAAAYISQRRPRYSVQQYLADFRRSDRKRTTLLHSEAGQLRRDYEAKNSIITTWQISFDYIRLARPSAGDLLALMSFFDRQGIPEHLLRDEPEEKTAWQDQDEQDEQDECDATDQAWEDEDSASQSSAGDDTFEDDVQTLRDCLFISVNADGVTFEMHGLVQLATRNWLKFHNKLERWQKESLRIIAKRFPTGEYETWAECQMLLPHAKMVLEYIPKDKEATEHRATIATKTAWYLLHMGDYKASEDISRSAIRAWKSIRGPTHKDTLASINQLGSALIRQRNYKEAEALHRQTQEANEKALGSEHPATLTSLSYLGSVLERQGELETSQSMHRRALEAREKVLGPEHRHTLTSASLLGQVLFRKDKYEEAEALHRRALEGRKKVIGPQHPRTLDSTVFLAQVLIKQRRYKEAEELNRRALGVREKVLGKEHPDTLHSVYHLADLLGHLCRYDEALPLYQKALLGCTETFGSNHPLTRACLDGQSFIQKQSDRQATDNTKHEVAESGTQVNLPQS